MPDWTLVPVYPFRIRRYGPPALIVELEDGNEIRRVKSSNLWREFDERYLLTSSEAATALAFYAERGIHSVWSRSSHDPADLGSTISCRFKSAPDLRQIGFEVFELEFTSRTIGGADLMASLTIPEVASLPAATVLYAGQMLRLVVGGSPSKAYICLDDGTGSGYQWVEFAEHVS